MIYHLILRVYEQEFDADHLEHNIAQGPHVNGLRNWTTQNKFWTPECGRETLHRMFTLWYFSTAASSW